MRRLAAIVLAAALVATGCSGDEEAEAPKRRKTSTTQPTPTTDPSTVELAGVDGTTLVPPAALGPGDAVIVGTVVGPDGQAIRRARIEVTRFASNGTASKRVIAGGLGKFRVKDVLGGRYRFRAWKQPTFATVNPTTMFVPSGQKTELVLRVNHFEGVAASSSATPSRVAVGDPQNLRVKVVERRVGPGGVVEMAPLSGVEVRLIEEGPWRVEGQNPRVTGGDGSVEFTVRCQRSGDHQLRAVIGGQVAVPVDPPTCGLPPTTTTEPPPESSDA